MYIKRISIKNIRAIYELEWELDDKELAGWHVLIGDNGSGKSTLLRAISLALIGPDNARALRQNWDDWLTRGQDVGQIELTVTTDKHLDSSRQGKEELARLELKREESEVNLSLSLLKFPTWRSRTQGWFSAAYGPFRRFTGGTRGFEDIESSSPKLAAHLSIFGEDVALTEAIRWLQDLKFKSLEGTSEGKLLDSVFEFVNQEGFLPHQTRLKDVSSSNVIFVDPNGSEMPVSLLSDGYRSILSMTFELIRQLQIAYPDKDIFSNDFKQVVLPGVVMIDEVDAHLHPTWQQKIGLWFREHFPNIQFIVTTHSPLVCQAADVGTVWKLPEPGTNENLYRISGQDLKRLLYGDILEAYSTEVFGENVTRSEKSQEQLERLAELNLKELHKSLTAKERAEQQDLRATLPTSAYLIEE
jgi:predicted ATP-dependent endonuclease of OLD family